MHMVTTLCSLHADISHFLPAMLSQMGLLLVQDNFTNVGFFLLGTTQRIRGTGQDQLLMVHKTSQQSNLEAPGRHDDDDALDCLVSFYGAAS